MCRFIQTILDTILKDTRKKFLICIFLVVATFCIYSQIQNHEFINFDDDLYITDNLNVQAGLTSESVKWVFTTSHPPYWHPVTWLSHMLDYQLYGFNPKGHYLTNLFLHISSVLVLFIVLLRMTGALWQSCFVAAIFALHPLNVESVAWIAERKNVLSTLFWLVTMWAYIYYVEKPTIKRYSLVFLFFTLGLMSKPMLVTLPFVLLLLDYWPLGRFQFGQERGHNEILEKNTAKRSKVFRLVLEKVPLFLLTVGLSIVTVHLHKYSGCSKVLGRIPIAGTAYQRGSFISGVFRKNDMAQWTVDIISTSREYFTCVARNIVWHGIGGYYYYFNQAY